ncbi:MAG: holo-ACP synthase [Candidatus Cellulosilyticum pullistercoris]|uniref:Holo-[acyl-carrier-protein] synthase n=1 Tax=Candidatus Cellulosilyticum pullistercoris TaxID=2838521 RepID=A0A9E2KAS0_9FIRM|nr:holo-ACP synthase [Candidatus Cellulosilyticum pullistercoris]
MIIGIGTDIIEIERIEKAIYKTDTFFNKIYTAREQAYYRENHKKTETLAGLFAAKEAISKALGTGFRGFSANDIEIVPNELGRPEVYLYGEAKALANRLEICKIHVSISHCQAYATAFAIAEGGINHEVTITTSNAGD